MNLDDIEGMKSIDRGGMLDTIEKFPEQVDEGMKIGHNAALPFTFDAKNVVISGMGGSAIGGEIIASLLRHESHIPIIVNRGYELPAFVSRDTLFIAVSYSGNTEETLSCFREAKRKGCRIIAISSGGKLEEMVGSEEHHIKIPQGMQPRAALAYLLFPAMAVLEKLGIAGKIDMHDTVKTLAELRNRIKKGMPAGSNPAKQIAMKIDGIPLIYGHDFLSTAARRWRQQLNENAKIVAFNFSVPEANHNELMAWEGMGNRMTCILLRDRADGRQISKRFDYMKEVYQKNAAVIEIFAEGKSILSRLLYAIYLGDYVSNYYALLRDIDPTPVGLIQELKRKL